MFYIIQITTPGDESRFFKGHMYSKGLNTSTEQCTLFAKKKDALLTMAQLLEKNPSFSGHICELDESCAIDD